MFRNAFNFHMFLIFSSLLFSLIFKDSILSHHTASKTKTSKDIEIVTSTASNKIWRLLRTNSSAVHLHVLILRDTPLGQISGTLQCSTAVSYISAIV